jgi:hypothetical protein
MSGEHLQDHAEGALYLAVIRPIKRLQSTAGCRDGADFDFLKQLREFAMLASASFA